MKSILFLSAFIQISWTFSTFTMPRLENPCPKNMAVTSDEKNNSVPVCKCLDTFLNYSDDDSCYDAYRQGPCPSEHYLAFSSVTKTANCEKNPCLLDGLVPYQNKCYFLWSVNPPCEEESHHLNINRSTFEVECNAEPYFGDMIRLETSKSCPDNSMLMPANDNQTEWKCECKPGFLFDAKNSSCHEAYRQGPCSMEHYFILPPGEKEAKCEKNSCLEDRLVPFDNECYPLYKFGYPCRIFQYLGIDEKTFQLKCLVSFGHYLHYHRGGIITAPYKTCPPGSRRSFNGCKRKFQ
ncbi:uncharacterized protein LOC122498511 [Leptopilina heterotoma]|uniref:uncharacterized protein LOC122498511 n=1 Tax=Leptopilina heterotoma TaxID=63436 RepID=UPI001CA9A44D|nr:uncharacterized protein LOC122498511 [Leptopilina heterotoma]